VIRSIFKSIYQFLLIFGIDLLKCLRSVHGIPHFLASYMKLKKQKANDESFVFSNIKPQLEDRYDASGLIRGHYFHQDLLIASRIFINNPEHHIDVGSRVDGFVAHVASFRKISVIDIRNLNNKTQNIEFLQADMMATLPSGLNNSCDSLSCLHALEHFGLGRYGDKVCWDGHLLGFRNLVLLLKQGGIFYFSVPIGKQRIEFNAHRVFSIEYLLKMFEGTMDVVNFSYVDDAGDLLTNVLLTSEKISNNCNCLYGCGIFELRKK
jgi:hypothetical protein